MFYSIIVHTPAVYSESVIYEFIVAFYHVVSASGCSYINRLVSLVQDHQRGNSRIRHGWGGFRYTSSQLECDFACLVALLGEKARLAHKHTIV